MILLVPGLVARTRSMTPTNRRKRVTVRAVVLLPRLGADDESWSCIKSV